MQKLRGCTLPYALLLLVIDFICTNVLPAILAPVYCSVRRVRALAKQLDEVGCMWSPTPTQLGTDYMFTQCDSIQISLACSVHNCELSVSCL